MVPLVAKFVKIHDYEIRVRITVETVLLGENEIRPTQNATANLSTANPTWIRLEKKPSLCGDRPRADKETNTVHSEDRMQNTHATYGQIADFLKMSNQAVQTETTVF
jgi:hypothetical protein